MTIQIGNTSKRIEILTQRVYSPVEQESYSWREQSHYDLEGEVAAQLRPLGFEDAVRKQLARESSSLLGCAARLLALTPQTVQFHYSSTEVSG